MKGYRDKDGFHIVLTELEAQSLGVMMSEGLKRIKKEWIDLDKTLYQKCVKDGENMVWKLDVIFIGDNYRVGGANKDNPIVVDNPKRTK